LVFVALAAPDRTVVRRIRWPGQREQIRAISAMVALDLLRRALHGLPVDEADFAARR
jgi:nicotinamide mononucleotide (NMN) deamidase PncC